MKPHNKSLTNPYNPFALDSIPKIRKGVEYFDAFKPYPEIYDEVVDIWFGLYLDGINRFNKLNYPLGKVWVEGNSLVWSYLEDSIYRVDCDELNDTCNNLETLPGLDAIIKTFLRE